MRRLLWLFLKAMATSLPDQLRTTVRFLGRVLGDVIRAEDGEEVFNQIEDIRKASVAFHREGTEAAAKAMTARLEGLSLPDTVRFAHSFACFLQITNIAEDQIQRQRGRGGDARPDNLAGALRSLASEGVDTAAVIELLRGALIAPVSPPIRARCAARACWIASAPSPTTSTPTTTPRPRPSARRSSAS